MPATDSFTSTATVVSSTTSTFSVAVDGSMVVTSVGFFGIGVSEHGVKITKASTLGGTQNALTFPITLDAARDLAAELIKAVN